MNHVLEALLGILLGAACIYMWTGRNRWLRRGLALLCGLFGLLCLGLVGLFGFEVWQNRDANLIVIGVGVMLFALGVALLWGTWRTFSGGSK